MSHSSWRRGQTEPIAALVAVSAFAMALGLYGIYVTDTLPGTTDRTHEEPALEGVMEDITENGLFRAHEHDQVDDLVDPESLPQGQNVYVEVRTIEDGEEVVVADGFFNANGDPERRALNDLDDGPPPEAGVVEHPISVAVEPGNVRGGTLVVGVWDT